MDEEKNVLTAESEPDAGSVMPHFEDEIIRIIRSTTAPGRLAAQLEDYHANDIAEVLGKLTEAERQKLFRVLDSAYLADIFEYSDDVGLYLTEMNVRKSVDILTRMDPNTAVEVLQSFSKERRGLIIDLLDDDTKKDIRLIASFDEDEIGSRMTTNYILIQDTLSVKDAMRELVRQAAENDNISTIYVEDVHHIFCGAIDLKDLITAREGQPLDDLIVTSYPYVYATENMDDCIDRLRDYSEDSIPVLDNENKLLGVITSQEIVEVVDDAFGDDYAKFAGLSAEEDLNEPIRMSIGKRLPWLVVLMCLGLLISTVVGVFEKVIAQLTIIMTFQTMILDMAGNVGTQSLAVTIRVLVDENLAVGQKFRLVFKEARVGLINGLILGTFSCVLVGLFLMLLKHKAPGFAFAVSGCIALALIVAMFISSLLGTLIPLAFQKIGVDPAVASGPLISTINDLVAVVTYYGLSWILLINTLHLA